MSKNFQALLWASIIITAAIIMNLQGVSDNASIGVVLGLSGAAWGSLQTDAGCGRGCLS